MEVNVSQNEVSDYFDEQEGEEEPIEAPVGKERTIYFSNETRRIKDLYDDYLRGDLDPTPPYQRGYVWDRGRASRLVESVFLNVPLPLVYTAEEQDGREIVIDGHQRLISFFSFISGKFLEGKNKDKIFSLGSLEALRALKGNTFQTLAKQQKRDFERYGIPVIKILRESDPNVKFDIFERLNKGSMALNDQELRNCVYRGPYNDLMKELASDTSFQQILNSPRLRDRMLDVELVLRFSAFYHNTHLRYKSPMKHFLNDEFETYRNTTGKEVQEFKSAFKNSVDLVKSVFGDKGFRRFLVGSKGNENGSWEATKVNRGLFDVLMFGFTQFSKNQVVPYADSIREEMHWLMTQNDEFKDSIAGSATDSKQKIQLKFDTWLKSLREIIGYPSSEPRNFSWQFKKQLWDANPVCSICSNKVVLLEDAEVDHIEFYWRGGKTIPSNARLVHRYCNRQRGGGKGA